jgi:hypothetical protein
MKHLITTGLLFSSLNICVISLSTQAKFKATGYNSECRSSSQWKYVKQYKLFTKSKSYKLIESSKQSHKDPTSSFVSLCLTDGNSLKELKLFPDKYTVPSTSTTGGNISQLRSGGNNIFTFEFVYDTDVAIIRKYQLDLSRPGNPKLTYSGQTSG